MEEVFEQVGGDVTVTPEEIAGLLSGAVRDFEWADEIRLARSGSLFDHNGDAPPGADAIVLSAQADDYRDALRRNDVSGIRPIVARYAARLGRPLPENGIDERLIARAILRMLIENCDQTAAEINAALKRREDGVRDVLDALDTDEIDPLHGHDARSVEPVLATPTIHQSPRMSAHAPGAHLSVAEGGSTFDQSWEAVRDDFVARAVWDLGKAAHVDSTRKLWLSISGDKRLIDITKDDAIIFRRTIAQLPNTYHRNRDWRDLPPLEVIALANEAEKQKNPTIARMSTKTVNRHISILNCIWPDFIDLNRLPKGTQNPFSGLHTTVNKTLIDIQEERDQFTDVELAIMFGSPIWTGCRSESRRTKPGSLIIRDWKFWIPLIGLFTGLRREEICAAKVEDIQLVDGVWIINLRKVKKRLKTPGSMRYMPIHETLLGIGFIRDLVGGRNAEEWLFPELEPTSVPHRWGEKFGSWFPLFRQNLEIYREGVVFHSFRHNVVTNLHNAQAYRPFVEELTGHSSKERQSEIVRYTKSTLVKHLKETIDKLDYGIDFSHLYIDAPIVVKS